MTSWLNASNYCESQNTSLWSINSHMEYEMVFTATKMNTSFWKRNSLEMTYIMFIGLQYKEKVYYVYICHCELQGLKYVYRT